MTNHRRILQIPSPRYFLDLDYVTIENCVLNFENAYYNYTSSEWEYHNDYVGFIPESKLPEYITEDEERRVALDYEREEHRKNSLYKSIGIY